MQNHVLFFIWAGIHATLMSVVLVDQYGADRLYNTLGIVLLFDGISSMLGPPVISKHIAALIHFLTFY